MARTHFNRVQETVDTRKIEFLNHNHNDRMTDE